YSSRLNVYTCLKLSPSSWCMRTSSAYTRVGVDPVARPNTQGRPSFSRSRTRDAMVSATNKEPSTEFEKIRAGIFSKAVRVLFIFLELMGSVQQPPKLSKNMRNFAVLSVTFL